MKLALYCKSACRNQGNVRNVILPLLQVSHFLFIQFKWYMQEFFVYSTSLANQSCLVFMAHMMKHGKRKIELLHLIVS